MTIEYPATAEWVAFRRFVDSLRGRTVEQARDLWDLAQDGTLTIVDSNGDPLTDPEYDDWIVCRIYAFPTNDYCVAFPEEGADVSLLAFEHGCHSSGAGRKWIFVGCPVCEEWLSEQFSGSGDGFWPGWTIASFSEPPSGSTARAHFSSGVGYLEIPDRDAFSGAGSITMRQNNLGGIEDNCRVETAILLNESVVGWSFVIGYARCSWTRSDETLRVWAGSTGPAAFDLPAASIEGGWVLVKMSFDGFYTRVWVGSSGQHLAGPVTGGFNNYFETTMSGFAPSGGDPGALLAYDHILIEECSSAEQ